MKPVNVDVLPLIRCWLEQHRESLTGDIVLDWIPSRADIVAWLRGTTLGGKHCEAAEHLSDDEIQVAADCLMHAGIGKPDRAAAVDGGYTYDQNQSQIDTSNSPGTAGDQYKAAVVNDPNPIPPLRVAAE